MERVAWLVLGVIIVVAAARAEHSARARRVGRMAFAALYIGAGALVNAYYLLSGSDYADFADTAHFAFVRDTWASLVVPHHTLFIGLLVAFELTVGLLALSGGRRVQVALAAAMAMHIALPVFGWIFTVWSLVMLPAFALLLRAEHRAMDLPQTAAKPSTPAPVG
jgi:hypothetical protein